MKAIALEVTPDRATVLLRPCWLARLFGARETVVELEVRPEYRGAERLVWHAVASRRPLPDLPHAGLIRDALDFRPRGALPAARLTSGDDW